MSKQVALAVTPRDGGGKSEARRLRREGRVPAIAYGTALAATPVSVDARELYHALHTDAGLNAIIRLDIGGETHLALARELQRHPVRRDILHVDFVTVSRDVKVHVDVPIRLSGEAPGAAEGGVVDQVLHVLPVEVLPLEVPDEIILDISELQIGDVRRVEDLALPSGVRALEDPDRTVVSVSVPTLEVPEAEVPEEEETLAEAAAGEAEPVAESAEAAEQPEETEA